MFRNPSGYSNGNTFDYEGRQLSCEHGGRRVVALRAERDGDVDRRASSRASGSTRPTTSSCTPTAASGSPIRSTASAATTRASRPSRRPRKPSTASTARRGRSTKVTDEVGRAERAVLLARLQEAVRRRHRHAARHQGVRRRRRDAAQRQAVRAARHSGHAATPSAADGIRCDVDGNIWAGARPGVQVIAPNGDRIGMIRLPETCANVCFGGAQAQPAVHDRRASRSTRCTSRRPEPTSPSAFSTCS